MEALLEVEVEVGDDVGSGEEYDRLTCGRPLRSAESPPVFGGGYGTGAMGDGG